VTDSMFEQVLRVEDTPEILDFVVPGYGFILWPYVRFKILSNCLERFFPGQYVLSPGLPTMKKAGRYAFFIKTIFNTLRPWPKRPIWNYSHVGSAFYKQRNGRLYNSYAEPLAECLPEKTLLVDASPGPEFIPATAPYALRRARTITLLAGKMAHYMSSAKYRILVDDFCAFVGERIQSVLGFSLAPDFMNATAEKLCHFTIPFAIAEQRLFSHFLKKDPPRLFIIDEAFYGQFGHLILAAKERGAMVADIQHGLVFKGHLGYFWADAMNSSDALIRQIPDYFLTYGSYWHDKMRLPAYCRLRVIGNPWFSIQAASQPPHGANGILFALNSSYEEFAPAIQAVVQAFPTKKIIVRPHPNEHQKFYASGAAMVPGAHIDTNRDIFDTFPEVDTVIGEFSTSLFDAKALGKRVFSRTSALAKTILAGAAFEWYELADELVEKLKRTKLVVPKEEGEDIFGRNWECEYAGFISEIGA